MLTHDDPVGPAPRSVAPLVTTRTRPAQTAADLERLITTWPHLPEHIRAAILTLVKTAEVQP